MERWCKRELVQRVNRDRCFDAYMRVMSRFGFGLRTSCLLLSHIFPLDNYLEDDRPVIKVRRRRESKKALMDNLKAGKMPVKKVRSTVCAKAVRLLFRELVAELFPGNRE